MSIRAFATLRSVLRQTESQIKDEQVTLENLSKWQSALAAAVKACYDAPLEGDAAVLDVDAVARVAVRVTERVKSSDVARDQAVRRALISALVGPALRADANDKKAAAAAIKGLNTVVLAACSGFIRYYCDRADTESGEAGAIYKLRAVRDALVGTDLGLAVARTESLLDPSFTLHLGVADFDPAVRAQSHDGTSRFHQRYPHDRPVGFQCLTVTFAAPAPAAPPAIQAAFVNETLVDAFWDWQASTDGAVEPPLTQIVKFAKQHVAVRSWSIVIASPNVEAIAAQVDLDSQTTVVRAPFGSTRVVGKPGKLVATPLLRDVLHATLRHFHGSVAQDLVAFTVVQQRMSGKAEVIAAALTNAAQPAKFQHADAEIEVTSPALNPPKRRLGWSRLSRVAALLAVTFYVIRRFTAGVKLYVALGALAALILKGLTSSPMFRRLFVGTPTLGPRRLHVLAVAIARANAGLAVSSTIRSRLVTLLAAAELPLMSADAAQVDACIDKVWHAASESDSAAAERRFPAVAFVPGAAAVARVLSAPNADVELAADTLLRQAVLVRGDAELLDLAAVCDAGAPVAWPRHAMPSGVSPSDVTIFVTDRTGVVAPMPAEQVKFVSSVAVNLLC